MTDIQLTSEMSVELIDCMASDARIIEAAKVSTRGINRADVSAMSEEAKFKFLDFLMEGRHGSPFEHVAFTFLIQAPIFVWREFMRHRIASYNEESGRYKQLDPIFYIPNENRKMVQEGRPGHYIFVEGTREQFNVVEAVHRQAARDAYAGYEYLLGRGIAREVARMSLPVNIMSSAYVTINARSFMNFLSLRTKREGSAYPSYPQREIEMVAEQMEAYFQVQLPLTWKSFDERGRVAP